MDRNLVRHAPAPRVKRNGLRGVGPFGQAPARLPVRVDTRSVGAREAAGRPDGAPVCGGLI